MKTHTNGPWRKGVEGNPRVYGPDNAGDHSGLIAVVFKGRGNVDLIAAAPLMLEALTFALECLPRPPEKNCRCHINPPCHDCVEHGAAREAFETMADAVAKAGGKA